MSLDARYPSLADLRAVARRRIPKFVWEYLDSATGAETTLNRNRAALDRIGFLPSILHGETTPQLATRLFSETLALPFGVAPVGMSGLIWPGAEAALAKAAAKAGLPYCLSTVAAASPEDVAPHLGPHAWFQLYPPRDPDIRSDILRRAKHAGFGTLVLTVDLPYPSRRERQTRSGLTSPPVLTPRLAAQCALRPAWSLATLRAGRPRMRTLDAYITEDRAGLPPTAHVGYLLRAAPDWDYVRWLRDAWRGPFVVKGVLRAADARKLEAEGVDAIWVSNHAGRQFDAAPASIELLPAMRKATALPLIVDSGFESGLDILRAFALGADHVMLGRGWHIAVAALGPEAGPAHLIHILSEDIKANMGQLGARDLASLPKAVTVT
ncbi:MAG: alpha-hydroxy acid oxidase [Pseudomonadota bacterium]